jgi:N-acetylmuramoyl-L-alanine amidase
MPPRSLASFAPWALAVAVLSVTPSLAARIDAPGPPPVVVLDPGHGGPDFGARGPAGTYEKDVCLAVSRKIGRELERLGFHVVYTRERDEFVSLAGRTEIANRARGDLFVSIHANSASDSEVEGVETYFLSVDASDEEAMRVAITENRVFDQEAADADSPDLVAGILGDLIRTENLRESSEIAASIQHNLGHLPGESRGVKQAPFVVLAGVNMPAALVEIGFLTHAREEKRLRSGSHQKAVAGAIAEAVRAYQEAHEPARRVGYEGESE